MGKLPLLTRSATAPDAAVVTRAARRREIGCSGPAVQHNRLLGFNLDITRLQLEMRQSE